jgi:Domain of unknown function (DUF3416)
MFNSQANSVFPGEPMPRDRLYIFESVSFSAIEAGRHFHVNGITVNKTIQTVESAAASGAFYIDDVYPFIDGGRFPVKRIVGERVEVWADIYRDGDDIVAVALKTAAAIILRHCEAFLQTGNAAALLTAELKDAMAESQSQPDLTRSKSFPLMADRPRARFGAWYKMTPRSQGETPGQHGTLKDCIASLPDIAAMGFDVICLTPIYPIGRIPPEVHEFWLPIGGVEAGISGDRRHIAALEDLNIGERYPLEWGGVRLRIDPPHDPALLFRCLA